MLRLPAVIQKTGRKRSTIYKDMLAGLFPEPVKIGRRANGWPEHEVDAINAARIAGRSDDEIRELVSRLVAERARAFDRFAA